MRAIFISYRREDSEGQAGRLFADLTEHFGEQAVFMDVAAIEPGRDFRKAIDQHVASCGVLLAVIGKDWLEASDAAGKRRLDDEGDFVRLETASALKREIPVVPVLVHGARMPRAEELPADLADLAYRNAIELTHARWDSDLSVLIKSLSRYVTPASAVPAEETSPAPPPSIPRPARTKHVLVGSVAIVLAVVVAAFLIFNDDEVQDFNANEAAGAAPAEPQQGSETPTAEPATDAAGDQAGANEPAVDERAADEPAADVPAIDEPTDDDAAPSADERYTLFGLADWDGDGHQDIVTRQNANDDLWMYPGQSKRGPRRARRVQIGNGWAGFSPFGVVDWDGDGHRDIVTRQDETGALLLYPGESLRGPGTVQPVSIGVGWNGYTFFGAADWDGDGHEDLVVRHDESGNLMLYPGESVRRMSNVQPSRIGTGWNGSTFVGMADWDGDGHQDIVTRNDTSGELMLYPGEGVRRMSRIQPSTIGVGWEGYSFFGITDWDGDGHQDIVTRNDTNADLMLYPGESVRRMSNAQPVKIGDGF